MQIQLTSYWFRSISFYSGVQTRQYYVQRDDKTLRLFLSTNYLPNDRYYYVNTVFVQPNIFFDKDIFERENTVINIATINPTGVRVYLI